MPLHRQLGLTDDELDRIVSLLSRPPTEAELAMFAVMWSEHCSYKSSRRYLGRFPTEAAWVLVGPGEGAGVIDVGHGLAVALRIESHNHPSAVEPYQGAGTGVGGIIRDVLSVGARPIALLNSLRFGSLETPRTRYLFEGVVSGISGYGNSVGVPTVGGEVVFDPCYTGNPLVNVLCLGVLPRQRLVLARAEGDGNLAVLVGASTGRDGIGGASVLASAGFEEGGEEKRPSVQVGDPFEEKKLIEACLDLLDAGLATGVQDLGAAGLCCAASETASRGGAGMDLDLGRVRQRETGMTPAEVLTSESQERMLVIVRPADLDEVLARCARLEVDASVVGRVTRSGRLKVFRGISEDEVPVADVPAASLGEGPVYDRPAHPPPGRERALAADPWPLLAGQLAESGDLGSELLTLLASPNVAEKSWVWRQYDHQLFLNTVAGPGGDAAVLRLRGTSAALAVSTDGKARFCYLDPRTGGRLAVLEAARNVACAGAVAKAMVNCLNFGNPEHPEVMWQFREVVEGMAEACEALGIPVVGGNVSFYNESDGIDIHPTPVVGVVGIVDPFVAPVPAARVAPGEKILLLGETRCELGGSEWALLHRLDGGRPPQADLGVAARLHELVRALVADRVVAGVHDCADGGLAVTLAEMAVAGACGLSLRLDDGASLMHLHPAAALFSESASRAVVAVEASRVDEVRDRAAAVDVPNTQLGVAGGDRLVVEGVLDVALPEVASAWRGTIPALVGERG